MDTEGSIRVQAGCAVLVLFDLIALCVLLYLALGAGMLVPMDCTIDREQACDAARSEHLKWLTVAFWTTVAVNIGFVVWVAAVVAECAIS